MRLLVFLSVVVVELLATVYSSDQAPLVAEFSKTAIPGHYIVVFGKEASDEIVNYHMDQLEKLLQNSDNPNSHISHRFSIGKIFRGYAAAFDDSQLSLVRKMREVEYIELDQTVRALQAAECVSQEDAPWNLVRTTVHDYPQNNPPKDYRYGRNDGEGVEAYIIDSGIDTTHPLFRGRAVLGIDLVDSTPPVNGDPYGHGTNMAGIVVADKYGLARSATAVSVRVMDNIGYGEISRIIAGLQYVAKKKENDPSKKMVGCMALGGDISLSLNNATDACVEMGVHIAVAGGNVNKDACGSSPASATKCITAAASDQQDRKPSFSAYGTCIDIIAPGDPIISLSPNNGTVRDVGTSQSSAHVTGVIARILSSSDLYNDPKDMKAHLKAIATKNAITGFPASPATINELLYYNDCQ